MKSQVFPRGERVALKPHFASAKFSLALLASFALPAHAGEWGFGSTFIEGPYDTSIDDERIEKCPKWKPEDGNPPISPNVAREIADRAFAKFFSAKKYPGWTVSSPDISLIALGESDWIWAVHYEASWKGYDFPDEPVSLTIYIPMDAKPITPEYTGDIPSTYESYLQELAEETLAKSDTVEAPKEEKKEWHFGDWYPRNIVATVTPEMLAGTPDWHSKEPFAPLSIDKAFHAAKPVSERWLPASKDFRTRLKEISLKQLQDDKWIWEFYYEQSFIGNSTGISPSLSVAVLMDGKAVEPVKVEPEKSRP